MANDKNVKKENKRFFKDFKAELKKVTWPTGKQLANNTIAVITIVLITAAIVFALDFCFELINKEGINKLKSTIRKDETQTQVIEEQTATPDANTVVESSPAVEAGTEESTEVPTTVNQEEVPVVEGQETNVADTQASDVQNEQ